MMDNEILQEIRATRLKLWEESGEDLNRLFEGLIQRQKDRPNLVDRISKVMDAPTTVEESASDSYNAKK